jgi:uncharacterized membrane protein
MLELTPRMGDFVFRETPLFRVHGAPASALDEKARRLVVLGRERTHEEDPAYGIRKLVDIAERSIATPFDDPTTAVQSIHRLHECLRQIAGRRFPTGRHCDADGHVRLTTRELDWGGYVRLAFDEVRLAGSGVPQVTRRLRAAIEDLKQVAPPERHPPLDRQLELLEAGVRRSLEDDADIEAALVPDKQGVGSGSDVLAAGANGSGGNSSEHPGVEHARR